jgi:hypothetical protein
MALANVLRMRGQAAGAIRSPNACALKYRVDCLLAFPVVESPNEVIPRSLLPSAPTRRQGMSSHQGRVCLGGQPRFHPSGLILPLYHAPVSRQVDQNDDSGTSLG